MFRRTLIAMASLAAAGAVCAQAYHWVDENGVSQYSDRPQPGAVRIELPTSQGARTRVIRPAPSTPSRRERAAPETAAPGYEFLGVASPGAEETLWNIGGILNVSLNLRPALQQGHRVRVYFDGEPQMVSGTSFQLPEVFRGVHNIQVEVVDQAGQLKIRSQTNRFYVQQSTVTTRRRPGN